MARSNDALYIYLTKCTVTYAHHPHDVGVDGEDGPEWTICPGILPESTPSVDADFPPARETERRKANNVNQAIEFLNAAGRRAGDR